jgi:glycosyltransferase involved in cell wall biosynthesis
MRFDAVVTHGSWPHAVFAPVVRRAGVRLATAVHSDLSQPVWLDRQAARTPPEIVIANSRFTAAPAAKLFPTARIEVVYLPVIAPVVDKLADARREVREALGTKPETVVILQASRLEEWKGHTIHLDALSQLASQPAWEAWIAGGPQKPSEVLFLAALQRKVECAGIGNRVRFLGQRADVPKLMAAADVYCQPNTKPEPFGLAFVEALSAGLPVVTSEFGGAVEIVDETCGVLVPQGDAVAVGAALRDLVADAGRRRRLGDGGISRARQLNDPGDRLQDLCTRLRVQSQSGNSLARTEMKGVATQTTH